MYFDGTWKNTPAPPPARSLGTLLARKRAASPPAAAPSRLDGFPARRYIGSFGVHAWATRSGAPLAYGDAVRIERARMAAARRKTQDLVVRFMNARGQEVGRLPQAAAAFVSTLVDQRVCAFEGVCVYAPTPLRTNDTVLLQLRVYMLRSAFERRAPAPDRGSRDIFGQRENVDEKEIRTRQIALVKLLTEIGLEPVRGNSVDERNKRDKILQAAEMVEMESGKVVLEREPSSTSQDEAEEGKELEQDQLDALYSALWADASGRVGWFTDGFSRCRKGAVI